MLLLYFHGFASSPASSKIALLRPILAADGIELDTPDLNTPSFEQLDWSAVVSRAVDAAKGQPHAAIVGSSLGALVALEVARRGFSLPLVLIAPALGVADQWISRIPDGDPVVVFNHARGADAPIHRSFFEQMAAVDADALPPPSRVTVIMGTDDESVPFARVADVWRRWEASGALASGSRFVELPGGDHGLTNYAEVIAEEIRRALR